MAEPLIVEFNDNRTGTTYTCNANFIEPYPDLMHDGYLAIQMSDVMAFDNGDGEPVNGVTVSVAPTMIDEWTKALGAPTKSQLDAVYAERDKLVAFLSKAFPSYLYPPDDAMPGFNWCVMVLTPRGQLSWHIRDDELPWFDHLGRWEGANLDRLESWVRYDGHTTEEKYARLLRLVPDRVGAWMNDRDFVLISEDDLKPRPPRDRSNQEGDAEWT